MNIFLKAILFFLLISRPAYAEERIQLGVILPLTGPLSIQGVPMKNAMEMAKNELDHTGRLSILFEDDQFLPKNSLLAAKKLIQRDKVNAIVIFGTNQGKSAIEAISQNNIPFLSINVNRSVISGRANAFLLMPSIESMMKITIKEMMIRGYKRLAILSTIQDSCLLQRDLVISSNQFKIVHSEEVSPGEVSARESALRIIKNNPDAVFLSVIPPHGSIFSRSLRELGYKGDIIGGLQIANYAEYKASNGALSDAWVVAGKEESLQNFYKRYRKNFGDYPTAEAAYAYDTIKLILSSPNISQLTTYLSTLHEFNGAVGKFKSDGQNGFDFEIEVKKFGHKGFEAIKR